MNTCANKGRTGGFMSNPGSAPFPEVTFSAFVMSIASSALVSLGEVPDPASGALSRDLALARHNIDVLDLIRQKTVGNLNPDEERLLSSVLCELRLKFVINCDSSAQSAEA